MNSTMQMLIDHAKYCHDNGMADDAFNALVQAITLLSEGLEVALDHAGFLRRAEEYQIE